MVVTHLINCILLMASHLVNFFFNLSFHGWPLICHVDRQWPSENTSYYYGITEAEQKVEKIARNIKLLVCL